MNRAERRAAGVKQRPEKVIVAYIHPGEVSAAFMDSVMRLRDYEVVRTQQLIGKLERRARAGAIGKARNTITAEFLKSDADWLFWLDADMGFPKTAYQQLRQVADVTERPIVGGLAFMLRTVEFDDETNAEVFDMMPTLQVFDTDSDGKVLGWKTWDDYPRNALCRVHATGMACVLIHRSILEQMREKVSENWFTPIAHPVEDAQFGEDTSFYLRAHQLDIPVHVHTGVRTSHDKGGIFLTEQKFDEQQSVRAVQVTEELQDVNA